MKALDSLGTRSRMRYRLPNVKQSLPIYPSSKNMLYKHEEGAAIMIGSAKCG